jgi:hypothetical protein
MKAVILAKAMQSARMAYANLRDLRILSQKLWL